MFSWRCVFFSWTSHSDSEVEADEEEDEEEGEEEEDAEDGGSRDSDAKVRLPNLLINQLEPAESVFKTKYEKQKAVEQATLEQHVRLTDYSQVSLCPENAQQHL